MRDHDDRRWRPARRRFLTMAAGGGSAWAVTGCAAAVDQMSAPPHDIPADPDPRGVSAPEDLMREHGVLRRILLLYEESQRRLLADREYDAQVLHRAADIVRGFVEDYHERLEEEHVFPRFEQAGKLVGLVTVLRDQHRAGRQVTDRVLSQTKNVAHTDTPALAEALAAFVRMYRPHAAREDTVLFPALREIVEPTELAEMGERFEAIEHHRFGAGGFEDVVREVAELERVLGIHDLARVTPS